MLLCPIGTDFGLLLCCYYYSGFQAITFSGQSGWSGGHGGRRKEVVEGADQGGGMSYVACHTGQVVCGCCVTDDRATDCCSQRWL